MTDPPGAFQGVTDTLPLGAGAAGTLGLGMAGPRLVEAIELLISCGADMDPLRLAAERTLTRFDHFLQFDPRAPFTLRHWSYHLDRGGMSRPDTCPTAACGLLGSPRA